MSIYRFADVRRLTSGKSRARYLALRMALDPPRTEAQASELEPDVRRGWPEDWELARDARLNVFLTGGEEPTRIFVNTLRPYFREPVVTVPAGGRLALPAAEQVGTLILYDVSALALTDQRRLVEWLEGNRGSTRVISTSRTSMLSRMAADSFLEVLYYRLNALYLEVTIIPSARLRPAAAR